MNEGAGRWTMPRGARRRLLLIAGGTVVVVAFVVIGGHEPPPDHERLLPQSPMVVHGVAWRVSFQDIPEILGATGVVVSEERATLSSKSMGLIDVFRVDEGTRVRKGELLLRLDRKAYEARLARADAEVDNADAHLKRMIALFREDSISKQDLDNARRAYRVALAARDEALAHVQDTSIIAPFDGVITRKYAEKGELAVPGQPLLDLENQDRLRLEVTVAEGEVQAVRIGNPVDVVVDALGSKRVEGRVVQIVPAADPATHTFLVKIRLRSADGVTPGMFGRVAFQKASRSGILVPVTALISRGDLNGVYVVEADDRLRLRWIKVGREIGRSLEVLSGVNPGELVLVDASEGYEGAQFVPDEASADRKSKAGE